MVGYMSLQIRFGQGLSENACPSIVLYLERNSSSQWAQGPCYHFSRHPLTWISWFRLPFGKVLNRVVCGRSSAPLIVPNEAPSIVLHNADDIWVVVLPIEYEIVSAPVHTVYYFWGHISCGEPSSQRRVIGSLSFLSALKFHCCSAGPGGSRWDESTYLLFGFLAVSPNTRHFSVSQELRSTQIR
jgi:hypothetical protein